LSARGIAHLVAIAADSVGSPLCRSTSSMAESEGICTQAVYGDARKPPGVL
jgi:hypothetical protein